MKEVIMTIVIAGCTGFFGWLFGNLLTKRQRKKSDLQMINDAISPLIISISQLTEQNKEIVEKLLAEQDKVLKLMSEKAALLKERSELIEKIDSLEKKVNCLTKKINELVREK